MDAIMAIVVVFLAIIAAQTQMRVAELNYWDSMYSQKLANDVIAALDEQGVLATLDAAAIESNITNVLPDNYEMWAEIESYTTDLVVNRTIAIGQEPDAGKPVVSGQRMFVSGSDYIDYYNIIRFKVWLD